MRVNKLLYLVVKVSLKHLSCHDHTLLEAGSFFHFDNCLDTFHSLFYNSNVLALSLLSEEPLRVSQESNGILGSLYKVSVEDDSRPSDAMLNQVREKVNGANGNTLLRRVHRVRVTLSLIRQDHLSVSFGTKCPRFQKRFVKPNAPGIHVLPGLDIVHSIYCEI